MIIFYGTDFDLNVTNLNIKFVEESNFFYSSFYKNYTPPFSMFLDDETSLKLGLIDVENVTGYTVKHEGKLFIDNTFFDATLLLEVNKEVIEGSFFYGSLNLPLLETPLKELPFPTINGSNIRALASSYLDKSWPEVPCNFPMLYDDDFSNQTNYDAFLGIINHWDGTDFIENTIDVDGNILNKNVMVPFPYILEILTIGFASEGKQITGGFVNKKENAHLLLDVKGHLERFSTSTENNFQFFSPTDQYLNYNILVSQYKKEIDVTAIGTYNIRVAINLPKELNVLSFKILKDSQVIFESTSKAIQTELSVNKEVATGTIKVSFILELEGNTDNIEDYNNFSFEKSEGKLNVFKNIFSLSEFMPDITFGAFLEKLKNWLNLKIEIKNSYVVIDYVEDLFDQISYQDDSDFEIQTPKIEFNQIKRYRLTTKHPETEIYVGKNGLSSTIDDIRKEDIVTINTGISLYNIEERDGVFTALRNEDADFAILLYNGKDANNYPVIANSVEGCSFTLQEVYSKCWRKWLYFRLNSETCTDSFTAHSLQEFSTKIGRYKYNKKHINKKISKQRISEEQFLFEIESETL
jgi:hypothetical protein